MRFQRNIRKYKKLSNQLKQKYRSSEISGVPIQKTKVSSQRPRPRRKTTANVNSEEQEKREIINKFSNKRVDELLKRQKFSPYIEESIGSGGSGGTGEDVCLQFDTGFEDDCNYTGDLYLLGPFGVFENYETTTDSDIESNLFLTDSFKYTEDYENDNIQGDTFLTDSFKYTEGYESNPSGYMIDFTKSPSVTSDIVDGIDTIYSPTNLNFNVASSNDSIELTWSNPNSGDVQTRIDRYNDSLSSYETLDTTSFGITSYTDSDSIVEYEKYEYRLKALSSDAESIYIYGDITVPVIESHPTLNSSLVSYWKFDGDATDSAGSNDGVVSGATNSSSFGKINEGYSFDGSNDHIQILTDSEADNIGSVGAYSVWFKSNSTSGDVYARILTRDANEYFAIWVDQSVLYPQTVTLYSS